MAEGTSAGSAVVKKYFVLIAYDVEAWAAATDEQRSAWHEDHSMFHRTVGEHVLYGEALDGPETATTVRHRSGEMMLTDGPFAETVETIGGFYVVQAADLDQVSGWCALLPDCYSLEIRPCIEIDVPV